MDGFNSKWGFPQCVGAIDETHILIIAPKLNALDYYNRKGHHSVILQAMVSNNYTFMVVYVSWPGSVLLQCVFLQIQNCSGKQKLVHNFPILNRQYVVLMYNFLFCETQHTPVYCG